MQRNILIIFFVIILTLSFKVSNLNAQENIKPFDFNIMVSEQPFTYHTDLPKNLAVEIKNFLPGEEISSAKINIDRTAVVSSRFEVLQNGIYFPEVSNPPRLPDGMHEVLVDILTTFNRRLAKTAKVNVDATAPLITFTQQSFIDGQFYFSVTDHGSGVIDQAIQVQVIDFDHPDQSHYLEKIQCANNHQELNCSVPALDVENQTVIVYANDRAGNYASVTNTPDKTFESIRSRILDQEFKSLGLDYEILSSPQPKKTQNIGEGHGAQTVTTLAQVQTSTPAGDISVDFHIFHTNDITPDYTLAKKIDRAIKAYNSLKLYWEGRWSVQYSGIATAQPKFTDRPKITVYVPSAYNTSTLAADIHIKHIDPPAHTGTVLTQFGILQINTDQYGITYTNPPMSWLSTVLGSSGLTAPPNTLIALDQVGIIQSDYFSTPNKPLKSIAVIIVDEFPTNVIELGDAYPAFGTIRIAYGRTYQQHLFSQTIFNGILTHEIGHTLGLGHSNLPGNLMQPSYSGLNLDPVQIARTYANFRSEVDGTKPASLGIIQSASSWMIPSGSNPNNPGCGDGLIDRGGGQNNFFESCETNFKGWLSPTDLSQQTSVLTHWDMYDMDIVDQCVFISDTHDRAVKPPLATSYRYETASCPDKKSPTYWFTSSVLTCPSHTAAEARYAGEILADGLCLLDCGCHNLSIFPAGSSSSCQGQIINGICVSNPLHWPKNIPPPGANHNPFELQGGQGGGSGNPCKMKLEQNPNPNDPDGFILKATCVDADPQHPGCGSQHCSMGRDGCGCHK